MLLPQQSSLVVAALALLAGVDAFAPPLASPTSASSISNVATASSPKFVNIPASRLFMADGDDDEEASDDAEASAEEEGDDEDEEGKEPEEDPEVTAIKKEISELETQLKSKKSTLSYTQDQAEEYTKAGYARKVAEMENMRRIRSGMNSSSRSMATANIVREFLPVYDKMKELNAKYGSDEFGKGYGGLNMESAMSKLKVQEYTVATGDSVDSYRMAVIDSEYSTEQAKDTVIRPVAMGLELEGNVIRAAECVASLGSEEDEKKAKEEAEAAAAAAAEAESDAEEESEEEAP